LNFITINFFLFFVVAYLSYWVSGRSNNKYQNLILLVSNLVFYSFWSSNFLIILLSACLIDYFLALGIKRYENKNFAKVLLYGSIFVNIGALIFFKYYNFFLPEFVYLINAAGFSLNVRTLGILLPVGISFYTLQKLSYTIDVYKKRIEPTQNLITYLCFATFFPTVASGPIERAINFIPQINKIRTFDYNMSVDGAKQILWGVFKKVVIADTAALYVNEVYSNVGGNNGSTLFLAAIVFSFQIYCDFSGYSDISVGISKLLGIRITNNFSYPYFSRSISEFWRKWHISLLTWLRVYVFMPLGGGFGPKIKVIRNTFIVFTVSGIWHGSEWTFVSWGILNAIYLLPEILNDNRIRLSKYAAVNKYFPGVNEFVKIVYTFLLVTYGWILFRSESIQSAFFYTGKLFSLSLFKTPVLPSSVIVLLILFLVVSEWIHRSKEHPLQFIKKHGAAFRYGYYYGLIIIIYTFMRNVSEQFLYFRF
jgi:D-alanyl-lipoteichoic acid acyltransferase DltB (MBOAT superfamily)